MPYCYEYPRMMVTADIAVFSKIEEEWKILLIKRKHYPFESCWALPGGFVEMDENFITAAGRELQEETGLTEVSLVEVGTFGEPNRDPRGRCVTVAFSAIIDSQKAKTAQGGDDAAEAKWFNITNLPELAFDHGEIIRKAIEVNLRKC